MYLYTVACEFEKAEVAREWVDWLVREHLAEVCAAGALSAEIVRVDGSGIRYQVHYRFPDRAAFQRYEREHVPRLREEGLRLFPLDLGLRYGRSTGEIIATHDATKRPTALPWPACPARRRGAAN